jgi:probable HAF family extracellular repeat protein
MHATLWQGSSVIDLGTLGGPNSSVSWPGQNNGGTIVGIAETGTLDPLGEQWSCSFFFPTFTGHICLGFVWESGVMTPLPTLGGNNGFATGVNSRGQVVGWAETPIHDPTCNSPQVLQFRAVLWEPKADLVQELPPLPGDSTSAATGINARGQVVGISGDCDIAVGRFSARHAVLWDKGTPIDIGDLGGVSWHTPMAINARGDVVGFSNPPGDEDGSFNAHAVLWPKGADIQDLGTLPGDRTSQALGINARGQVVGVSRGPGGSRAFIWENGVMTDLNTLVEPGYSGRLLLAGDISDRGEITGATLDPDTGEVVTFVATPVGTKQ